MTQHSKFNTAEIGETLLRALTSHDPEATKCLAVAMTFAIARLDQFNDPIDGIAAAIHSFAQALADPLDERLDHMRADPDAGPKARAERAAQAQGGAA